MSAHDRRSLKAAENLYEEANALSQQAHAEFVAARDKYRKACQKAVRARVFLTIAKARMCIREEGRR